MGRVSYTDFDQDLRDFVASTPTPDIDDSPENQLWYAYKRGEVTKCSSEAEARFISPNFESVVNPEFVERLKAWWAKYHDLQGRAYAAYREAILQQYSFIPATVVDRVYAEAESMCHSGGYSEVESRFEVLMDLVIEVQALMKA